MRAGHCVHAHADRDPLTHRQHKTQAAFRLTCVLLWCGIRTAGKGGCKSGRLAAVVLFVHKRGRNGAGKPERTEMEVASRHIGWTRTQLLRNDRYPSCAGCCVTGCGEIARVLSGLRNCRRLRPISGFSFVILFSERSSAKTYCAYERPVRSVTPSPLSTGCRGKFRMSLRVSGPAQAAFLPGIRLSAPRRLPGAFSRRVLCTFGTSSR